MNLTLLWFMLIPIIGGAGLYALHGKRTGWPILPMSILPGAIFLGIVFAVSYGSKVADTEIWSGKITSKLREHGSYQKAYDCNCRPGPEQCSGTGSSRSCTSTTVCDTCYEDHYTVKWSCNSTIGAYTIDSLDRTSNSVYSAPNPSRWLSIQPGDPAAKTHTYTNYVQAVPNSLYATVKTDLTKFNSLLAPYPDAIYDLYRINRFVSPGFNFTDTAQWNQDISLMLRDLGPSKQVNVIVVIVKSDDQAYALALQKHWDGANKNDVVLVIGTLDGQHPLWTHVISWTKEELFKIELRDQVQALGTIDRTKIIPIIEAQIKKNFVRRHMAEFEYLAGEIDPPEWLLALSFIMLCLGYGATHLKLAGYFDKWFSGRRRY